MATGEKNSLRKARKLISSLLEKSMTYRAQRKDLFQFNLSFITFALITALVVVASLASFYDAAVDEKLSDLDTVVKTQALLISEVYNVTKDRKQTLEILRQAKEHLETLEIKGEFILAFNDNDSTRALVWRSSPRSRKSGNLPLTQQETLFLQNASRGKNTTRLISDFNGVRVLFSHAEIEPMNMELFVKVPLWDLQRLFLILAAKLLGIGTLITSVGILAFRYFNRKKEEEANKYKLELENALQNLRAFKQGMDKHSMLSMADSQGVISKANRRFSDITGFSKQELIGQKFSILNSGEQSDEFYDELWSTIKSNRVWHGEIKNKKKDGSFFWAETTIAPVKMKQSLEKYYICIQTDISIKKAKERSLQEAKSKAERANKKKSDFLAHMSHEIRTPLSSILGYTDLVEKDKSIKYESQRYIQIIKRNSHHLLSLVGEILDFSKIEAGQLEIKKSSTLLMDEIQKIQSLFDRKDFDISFSIDLIPPLPEVIYTDSLRLRQILINLISNAFKYTEKGSIRVQISLTKPDTQEPLDKLKIEIKDTGIGVAVDHRRKIFRPFMQSTDFLNREKGGAGLGLALSREIAQLLGGDVILKTSTLDKGSVFVAYIDYKGSNEVKMIESMSSYENGNPSNQLEKPLGQGNQKNTQLKGIRVLLVEDSEDICELVKIHLQDVGAEVKINNHGESAIVEMKRSKFDVILLDIQLPKISGHYLIHQLREFDPLVPVIALTAHSTKSERNACLENGFNDFLAKPVNFDKLIETVYKWHYAINEMAASNSEDLAPLFSTLTDDPMAQDLVKSFAIKLVDKVNALGELLNGSEWKILKDFSHQLKGACGSFGYPEMQELAGNIETVCQANIDDQLKTKEIQRTLDKIELLARRAEIVYSPDSTHL
jgi:PAS domain S-box-containing protein